MNDMRSILIIYDLMSQLICLFLFLTSLSVRLCTTSLVVVVLLKYICVCIAREMKKDIRMISGCEDKQTSADVSNVNRYVRPFQKSNLCCRNLV